MNGKNTEKIYRYTKTTSGFQKTEIKIDTFKNEIQQNCPDDEKMFFSPSEKEFFTNNYDILQKPCYKPNFSIEDNNPFILQKFNNNKYSLTNDIDITDLELIEEKLNTDEQLNTVIQTIMQNILQIPKPNNQTDQINLRKTYNELYLLLYLFFQYVIFTNQIQTYHEFIESPKRNASTTRDEMLKIIN